MPDFSEAEMPVSGGRGGETDYAQAAGTTNCKNYQGVLGHYHIQTDKMDPGPAFDWDRVIGGAQRILRIERFGKD